MGATFTAFSGSITRAAWETNLDAARTWLNAGIVVGDIVDGELDAIHVYRPDTFGWPKQSTEGVTQAAYQRQRAIDSLAQPPGATDSTRQYVARVVGRQSIFTEFLLENETWPIASLAARIYVPDDNTVVDWSVNLMAKAISAGQIGTTPTHPDTAGSFSIRYKAAGAASSTQLSGSTRNINAGYWQVGTPRASTFNLFTIGGQTTLSAGVYDTWVEYDGSSVNTGDVYADTVQIVIGLSSFVVETHRP